MKVIVVGVDGSAEADGALRWAGREGRLRAVPVRAVYAYDYTPAWQTYAYAGEGMIAAPAETVDAEQEAKLAEQRALDLINQALGRAEASLEGVAVEPLAVWERRPASALLDQCADAELLVVGNRGRGGFAGLLLGSVSQQCVQHARCPVVIVPSAACGE